MQERAPNKPRNRVQIPYNSTGGMMMTDSGRVPSADFVEHVAGAISLAVGDEAAALAAIAEIEHRLVRYLRFCAESAVGSGSSFNQGVVRGLEIATAQIEYGHYQNATAAALQSTQKGSDNA
jgi:hypothetical protein